jgi:hypothetical protein
LGAVPQLLPLELLLDDALPPKMLASLEVALMPLLPLMRVLPQVVSVLALKFWAISSEAKPEPLPDHDQPK